MIGPGVKTDQFPLKIPRRQDLRLLAIEHKKICSKPFPEFAGDVARHARPAGRRGYEEFEDRNPFRSWN